ncbi:MAG: metallophosphoesterase [Alphaproteobacteria bacterium 16-39-46]|nr:MAG: metallophosphoesterase [Alphaproteobacteria bacterium 16-39-46]OZA43899.1 MAG: metallophosphoesterase [Alphaproteobacteria bacterium 17-39-52]HQS83688.1 TIGR00282 family metallophosphoesterase [Alphaproteobacteria bacterium]HQS93456.1 TIGR00282 family metallophosphoesterase [Alphaproteobacteria bacterium]
MRLLYFGDVVGRSGREVVLENLPALKDALRPDFTVLNGENSAAGFGITQKICEEFFKNGIDCITLGNHSWDQKEILTYIGNEPRLLRPLNYPPGVPGKGFNLFTLSNGRKILIIQVMGRLFMDALDDPFRAVDEVLKTYPLGTSIPFIFVDIHAEATSEKMALAHYLDGRVTAVVGTHTHIPTADEQIFPLGTAYQSDVGMCGDYNSVIGMKKEIPISRFTKKISGERMVPAEGKGDLCAVFIVSDDKTGRALSIDPIRMGPRLSQTFPKGESFSK